METPIDTSHHRNDKRYEVAAPPSPKTKCQAKTLPKKGPLVFVKDNIPSPDSRCTPVDNDNVTWWNPKCLSRPMLGAFLTLFVVMLASLQIINSYSAKHQGLATTDQTKRYLWTFGPTACQSLAHSCNGFLLTTSQSLSLWQLCGGRSTIKQNY
jgi:hypothetical protein